MRILLGLLLIFSLRADVSNNIIVENSVIYAADINQMFSLLNNKLAEKNINSKNFTQVSAGELISKQTLLDNFNLISEVTVSPNISDEISSTNLNENFNNYITAIEAIQLGTNPWNFSLQNLENYQELEIDISTTHPQGKSFSYSFDASIPVHNSVSHCLNLIASDGPDDTTCKVFNNDNTLTGTITLFKIKTIDEDSNEVTEDFNINFTASTTPINYDPNFANYINDTLLRRSLGLDIFADDVSNIQRITQNSIGYSSLEGIEYMKSLWQFRADRESSLSSLEPLSKLDSLEILELFTLANVNSLPDLRKNTSLYKLDIRSTPITDISQLDNFQNLEYLRLENVPLSSGMDAIRNLPNLTEMQLLNTTSQLNDINFLSTSNKLTRMNFRSQNLTDISPITNLINPITYLALQFNPIADLAPLNGLMSQATHFYLQNTGGVIAQNASSGLSDLGPAAIDIIIHGIDSIDLTSFNGNTTMNRLAITAQQINNLNQLNNNPNLSSFQLYNIINGNDSVDFTGLSNLPDLSNFIMSNYTSGIIGIDNIANFTTTTDINFTNCALTNINFVTNMNNLDYIKVENNSSLSDITPLQNKNLLAYVNIGYTNVSDISELSTAPLTQFRAKSNIIQDWSPLANKAITTLEISSNTPSDYEAAHNSFLTMIPTLSSLVNLYYEHNEIRDEDLSALLGLSNLSRVELTPIQNPSTTRVSDLSCGGVNVQALIANGVNVYIDNVKCSAQ